ncbi:hypothetical protein M404DRAFT_993133 [Pisolithus tinctorius Marx 270]|uniref:CDP-diacylglycerol--glycerol-3-phosphate 3-phosphatidyltransferase n=1 Tax=Pisolithus tinctorius Marx 270 TaxID=870435 RepID=A0A0C3PW78_PISTI|nr:hypothetical protein M404DRAFT_993133 [Pisolithus tinctorius Marx 270]
MSVLNARCTAALHRSFSCRRHVATQQLHPCLRDFASALAVKQPCFSLASKDVHILHEPTHFYSRLLGIIRRARRRIFLSSLYIGSEERELLDALDSALRENPGLHVYLLLDYNRSTRPGASSPVLALLPLLRSHQKRVHVSLFRSPMLSRLATSVVPPRFKEGWGTWHAKVYGSDDELIVSGANLNRSYFTNRKDRYLHFNSQPILADYCFSFLRLISGFSYQLALPNPASTEPAIIWPDPCTNPWKIQPLVEHSLSKFQSSHLTSATHCHKSGDVLLFPMIQGGQFNIREEERTVSLLFQHLAPYISSSAVPTPLMNLTSGYFGLYRPYQEQILKSSVGCNILVASPQANGFYGSHGLSGLIPEGYTLLEQRFMRAVRAAGRDAGPEGDSSSAVRLSEWVREGWTYHAKGIWFSPSQSSPPVLTLFGSTNLNSRSANLDTELSFVMLTSSEALRKSLQAEVNGLWQCAVPWRGAERHVRWRTRTIVGMVGGML